MDNLTLDLLSTLLSHRKLVLIDKVTRPLGCGGLRFTFDCENGRVISLILTPEHQNDNAGIKITFG